MPDFAPVALDVKPQPSLGPVVNTLSEIQQRQASTALAQVQGQRANALYNAYQTQDPGAIARAGDISGAKESLNYSQEAAGLSWLHSADGRAAIAGDAGAISRGMQINPAMTTAIMGAKKAIGDASSSLTDAHIKQLDLGSRYGTAWLMATTPAAKASVAAEAFPDPQQRAQFFAQPPEAQDDFARKMIGLGTVATAQASDKLYSATTVSPTTPEVRGAGLSGIMFGHEGATAAAPTAAPAGAPAAASTPAPNAVGAALQAQAAPPAAGDGTLPPQVSLFDLAGQAGGPRNTPTGPASAVVTPGGQAGALPATAQPDFASVSPAAPPLSNALAAKAAATRAALQAAAAPAPVPTPTPAAAAGPAPTLVGGVPVERGPGGTTISGGSPLLAENLKNLQEAASQPAQTRNLAMQTQAQSLLTAVNSPSFYSGSLSQQRLGAEKFWQGAIGMLGIHDPEFDKNIGTQEWFSKVSTAAAAEIAKTDVGSRVTNFDLSTFIRNNPGIETSPEGNKRLIGITAQIAARNTALSQAAAAAGNNYGAWEQQIRTYDGAHPIVDPESGTVLSAGGGRQGLPVALSSQQVQEGDIQQVYHLLPGAKVVLGGVTHTYEPPKAK